MTNEEIKDALGLNKDKASDEEEGEQEESGEEESMEVLIDLKKSPFDMDSDELETKWWMEPFVKAGKQT